VDFTGRLTGYAVINLADAMGAYEWRIGGGNAWKVERVLLDFPHRTIRSSNRRVKQLRARYRAFRSRYPGHRPCRYEGRETWSELPPEFNRDRNLEWVS
jgi:hypothetical protein